MSADYAYGNLANGREVNCENGCFMLGDASIDSQDSRYTGVVTKDRFRGRVWCVVAPAERRGFCVKTQTDRSLQAASPPQSGRVDILRRVGLSRTPLVFEHGERFGYKRRPDADAA